MNWRKYVGLPTDPKLRDKVIFMYGLFAGGIPTMFFMLRLIVLYWGT